MINEIMLSIIQAATEFLPVSSSGHLALYENLFSKPNLFFVTFLHIASLLAVIFFTRKELYELFTFKKESRKLWIYWIIATIPAALVGLFFKDVIESAFSSLLFLGIAFLFTGTILLFTKFQFSKKQSKLNIKNSIIIGLFQAIALFPGVSRSGMTISSGLFSGIEREKAARFSFLLFIPLALGAFALEIKDYISGNLEITIPMPTLVISFIICFFLSIAFLRILTFIIKKDKFWMFSIYCYIMGIITLLIYSLS